MPPIDAGHVQILASFAMGFGVPPARAEHIGQTVARKASSTAEFADTLLAVAAASGAADRGCVFVSTPITRGKRYLEWRARNLNTPEDQLQLGVMAVNRLAARDLVARVRATYRRRSVIDPTRLLDIPEWAQSQYHELWRRVIVRFAHTMVFAGGWEYSIGCATEYGIAVRLGVPTLTCDFRILDATAAASMLAAAAARYVEFNLDPADLLGAMDDAMDL